MLKRGALSGLRSLPFVAETYMSPCPTNQLWPFSSAKENHPKMPIWDPQNELPGFPLIGLFLGMTLFFKRKTLVSQNCPAFPWRGLLGSPGEDEVDMLGSGDLYWRHFQRYFNKHVGFNNYFVADAETAFLCSLDGAWQRRSILDTVFRS